MKKGRQILYPIYNSRKIQNSEHIVMNTLRNPSFGWESLQDVYYRNRELCQLSWPNNMSQYKYSLSITVFAVEVPETNKLDVYNYLGKLLASIEINTHPDDTLLKFQFDPKNEDLLLVTKNCIRRIYNWSPLQFQNTYLPENTQDTIWDFKDNILILQTTQDLYYYDNADASIQPLFKNEETFTLLTRQHWDCNDKEVVLLDLNHVFHFDIPSREMSKSIPDSQWHSVSLSSHGFTCLYNSKFNRLVIYKHPSANNFLLDVTPDSHPDSINWCGNDTIACLFAADGEVKLFGPRGSYVTFWYPNDIFELHTEMDGVKIATLQSIHFISKVQDCTANIFRIGSTESGAILLDSIELLSNHAPRAIENLKIINLEKAVSQCIDAASEEFDPQWQKKLLSAASFGKDSLPYKLFDPRKFVETCDLLRVLNVLKSLGIFVTATQFKKLTLNGIINRLLKANNFYDCFQICQFLNTQEKIPTIIATWASTKIQLSPDMEDDELFKLIEEQCSKQRLPLPMAQIGQTAFFEGRFNLARKLILKEPLSYVKLPMLLELDDNQIALKEAQKTGIPELTLSVLLKLENTLTVAQFTKLLILIMQDDQLFNYYSRDNYEFLYDFYRQTDKYVDLAHLVLRQGKKNNNIRSFLPQVEELYSRVLDDPLIKDDKDMLNRQAKLYQFQEDFSAQYQVELVGLTMDETLAKLISTQQHKQVTKILKTFKISDKKYYHIKCKTLAKEGKFDELYNFAQERKSPIGYLPFYNYLMKEKHKREAIVYISMLSGVPYSKRLQMHLKCGSFYDAIQLATKEKDIQSLKKIYNLIPSNEPQLKTLVTENMSKL